MNGPNDLLSGIENRGLWAFWHKDWLLEIRDLVRPQLPRSYSLFVESETILISPPEDCKTASVLPDLAVTRSKPGAGTREGGNATAVVLEVEETCEVFTQYSLQVRRAPDNRLVAACEIISPTNRGRFSPLDREKYLRKRALYFAVNQTSGGVNLLEVDALTLGDHLLPPALLGLAASSLKTVWAAFHHQGRRRFRGWAWNVEDPLPVVEWDIEEGAQIRVDLALAFEKASKFNDWPALTGT